MTTRLHRFYSALLLLLLFSLSGCANLIESQTRSLSDNLAAAVLESPDLKTVEQGGPAFLLILDGLIRNSPESTGLLQAGARLNGAYGAAFAGNDSARSRLLAQKSLDYALRATCLEIDDLCQARSMDFDALNTALADTDKDDAGPLYILGVAWMGWLIAHSSDWSAIAELPRAAAVLERVLALDESFDQGGAHLYLGGVATLLPPAMGGKPEVGRRHFERAIALSEGRNLMAKVMFARQYARLTFDKALHDKLLREVLAADPQAPGFTLINTAAQIEARELLAGSDDYF